MEDRKKESEIQGEKESVKKKRLVRMNRIGEDCELCVVGNGNG